MSEEPNIPVVEGDLPQDPPEIKGKTKPIEGDPNAVENEEQPEETLEQVKKDHEELTKKITEGWKEDREFFQGEITRLRSEANNPKLTEAEESQLEGLDENARVDKLIEFKKGREDKANEAEVKSVKSELTFYRRTDPNFKKNEKGILKVAQDYDCKNLQQAVLMWKGLNKDKTVETKKYNDKRKKEADGGAGGKGGGKTTVKPYDKKEDGKKSYGDLYAGL